MANPLYGGFRPWGTLTGGQGVFPSPIVREVANNNTLAIGKYDILTQSTDGTVLQGAAADNGKLVGVAIGFSMFPSQPLPGRRPVLFIPAATTFSPTTVGSVQAPWIEFLPLTGDLILEVCADDASSVTSLATALAIVGENVDLATTATPDTTTGLSGMQMDISTHVTSTANFRILGISGYPPGAGGSYLNNDITLINARYLVTCNESVWPPYTATGV
jgi:hypothetical protein